MKPDKLELRWIGKQEEPRPEPRLLEEDESLSYGTAGSGDGSGPSGRIIQGDNLLALKALEPEFSGAVQCIYIDPPYNTGNAFEHYDDGVEHSIWLSLMRDRLKLLHKLLADTGLIFVQIDDHEMPYLAVLMDELFGRSNRVNTITVKMSEASGVKMAHSDKRLPKVKEYILVYKKQTMPTIQPELVPLEAWNDEYKTLLLGLEREAGRELDAILAKEAADVRDVERCNELLQGTRTVPLAQYFKEQGIPPKQQEAWKFDNAWRIIQAVGSSSVLKLARSQPHPEQEIAALLSPTGLVYLYKTDFDRNARQPRVQVLFAHHHLFRNPGDFWTDIKTTGGVGQEGGVLFPNGKKPEKLIKRIIGMCTKPGDWVLDSFAGSGTTGAVAHKMGRRWLLVEMGKQCETHIVPRLRSVVDGTDQGGVSKELGWRGGGGFRFYRLAPSLLAKDEFGQWVVSPEYSGERLARAVCLLKGFRYDPDESVFWKQGRSSERDYLYVAPGLMTRETADLIAEQMAPDETLLVLCRALALRPEDYPQITFEKMPAALVGSCDFGIESYGPAIVPGAEGAGAGGFASPPAGAEAAEAGERAARGMAEAGTPAPREMPEPEDNGGVAEVKP